jgi:hypothetical protein
MQGAGRRFTEIRTEEDQGDDDDERENRTPPPDLLVVHEGMVSKVVLRSALRVPGMKLVASAAVA